MSCIVKCVNVLIGWTCDGGLTWDVGLVGYVLCDADALTLQQLGLPQHILLVLHYSSVLLHNGGFCNGCITKRILFLHAFHS
jgi:hypothetical protein